MCHEIMSNYFHRNLELAGMEIFYWKVGVKILINASFCSLQAKSHPPLVRIKGVLNLLIFIAEKVSIILGGRRFFPPIRPISDPPAEF